MIEAGQFVEAARKHGFTWYTGVPCSFLTPFINYVLQDPTLHYLSAANEGDAVAIAAGATLGEGRGARSVTMMQNSGLGNAVSPLTSLTWTFRLPQLLIVTWRGQPGITDEPQHALMGPITPAMLDLMAVPWERFPTEPEAIAPALARAVRHMDETGRPYALVMQKGSVAPYPLQPAERPARAAQPAPVSMMRGVAPSGLPTRRDALERLLDAALVGDQRLDAVVIGPLQDRSHHEAGEKQGQCDDDRVRRRGGGAERGAQERQHHHDARERRHHDEDRRRDRQHRDQRDELDRALGDAAALAEIDADVLRGRRLDQEAGSGEGGKE